MMLLYSPFTIHQRPAAKSISSSIAIPFDPQDSSNVNRKHLLSAFLHLWAGWSKFFVIYYCLSVLDSIAIKARLDITTFFQDGGFVPTPRTSIEIAKIPVWNGVIPKLFRCPASTKPIVAYRKAQKITQKHFLLLIRVQV